MHLDRVHDDELARSLLQGTTAATRVRVCRLGGLTTALLAAGTVLAAPASAHVDIVASTTAAGARAVLELDVPHGCDGSATTALTVTMPPEITSATPTRRCGRWRSRWSRSTRR